jgi:hypothetical protein
MYRLKTRIAGVPIISNWDMWKALYGENKRAYFFHQGFPYIFKRYLSEYNFLISFGWGEISVISASLVPAGICGDGW